MILTTQDPAGVSPSGAISAAPPYHRSWPFLAGGPPEEIRGGKGVVPSVVKIGYRGVVPMQYHSPSTVLLLIPSTSPEAGF